MNLKKYLLPLLCFILLFSLTVACRNSDDLPDDDDAHDSHLHGYNLDAAMAFFAPDTVILSAGDALITWAEFYVFLHNAVSQLTYGFSVELDWDDEFMPEVSFSEGILDYAKEHVLELLVFEYATSLLGVSLSQEDLDLIQDDFDNMVANTESPDTLEDELRENGFMSFEVFKKLREREFLPLLLLTTLYGEELSDIPDDVVADFAEENDFMRAKHILLAFLREEDGHSLQEIDEHKLELRDRMDSILNRLVERYEDDDFLEFFDELMWEYNEDPGMFASPDGYLFQPGDMVAPFSEACAALLPGQISSVVVTSYGYHILLRLPLNYDEVPFSMVYAGYDYSLRMLAIIDDFEYRMDMWRESMNVDFSGQFNSIKLSDIFVWNGY